MFYIFFIVLFCVIVYLPHILVQHIIKKWHSHGDILQGSGAEFALHIFHKMNIKDIEIIKGEQDYYDPLHKKLCLDTKNYELKTLSAIVITAHEIGHIIQDYQNNFLFRLRIVLVKAAQFLQSLGWVFMASAPLIGSLLRLPTVGILTFLIGILCNSAIVLVHFVTLPVEIDASFKKAMPLLIEGGYIPHQYYPAAKNILRAASLTYLTAAFYNIFHFWNLIRILRGR